MASSGKKPPFPTQQMVILAISRFAEPVASTSVYPYIPELVGGFNVPTDKIGMYSGWLSGVFSLCQAITGIAWGRASDKLGRKPIILLALFIVMVGSLGFGFSSSLAMAFVMRSVQGAASGNVGIIRTAVAEMVPQKELQPLAFSIMPLVWNIGSIFGPSLGGFLSNPQRHGWFTGSELFRKYPFALPNLVISTFFLIGIASGLLFLKETHEDKKNHKDYGLILGSALTSSCSRRKRPRWYRDDNEEADPFLGETGNLMSPTSRKKSVKASTTKVTKQTSWRAIFSRQSNINLVAYTGLAMHSVAFDQLMPVFMHHPPQSRNSSEVKLPFRFAGGFGLESGRIGVLFTVYGIFGMMVQFFLFPPLARRFGVLNCLKACVVTFPCVYLVIPFTSLLSTSTQQQAVCLTLMLVKCAAGIFAFPCSTILLTNSAASLSVLGTLNGVATSISAAGRAAGPALTGWAFTKGVDIGYVVVPFWTLFTVAIIAAIPVWSLVEMEGFNSKSNDTEDTVESDDETADQQLLRREEDEAEIVRDSGGLGILSGTEEADLLDIDDLPIITQTTSRSSYGNVERRPSTYSLHKAVSPVATGQTGEPYGSARRYSTD